MNEIIEHCMYESGLTADGCWNELDDYAKESIERFAVLIVKKCAELCLTYGEWELLQVLINWKGE